ncbi:MAG: 2-oxoacid:acceptor oxidoreductase family protein, partial [Candidatus Eisenbacteria bacterium]
AVLGDIILQMAAQQGLYGVMVQSYGPQIRGGESAVVMRVSRDEVQFEGDEADLLLCFRAADLKRFLGAVRLHAGSVMVLESLDEGPLPEWLGRDGADAFRYPFARMEAGAEVAGEPKNMKALALIVRLLGWSPELARETLGRRFGHRPARLAENLVAFDHALATEGVPTLPALTGHGRPLHVETGNEAIARGAMDAGLGFFAGYPITPSSEIMETLIEEFPGRGGRVVQAEDEIAALGMVLGASFGGVPAMTATSGPGLSLMTEMLGLASMAELPAVIVDCQRAGPATGMPSRTEQSDLFHAIYGGHGDFPRAVLGVFDVVHARAAMAKALHLSETYQMPVLVLSDAYIAQRRQILEPPGDPGPRPYRRRWTPDDGPARFDLSGEKGVNAFRVPGTPGGSYPAAGIEHTPEGLPTADTTMHHRMNTKRFAKLDALAVETAGWCRTFGRADASFGLVAWGSQYGLLREWVSAHPEWRVFLPEILHPFPLAAFEMWRKGLERAAVLELSFQGQFHHHLSGLTDVHDFARLGRSGGVPITLRELARLLENHS